MPKSRNKKYLLQIIFVLVIIFPETKRRQRMSAKKDLDLIFFFFFIQKTFFSKDLLVPINRALNAPGREEMQGHSMITVKVVIFC